MEDSSRGAPAGVAIVSEGILSCWHGHYHYVEPWVGCEHNCLYCYAKFRSPVRSDLNQIGTSFNQPKTKWNERELLKKLAEELAEKKVVTAKLCRYTDILSPRFVESGLAYKVIEVICKSEVKRIILTTKGVPNQAIADLLIKFAPKISYNIGTRPQHLTSVVLEPHVSPLKDRLEAAARLAKAGMDVCVHMDPLLIGIDDREEYLQPLLELLLEYNLRKVVFSYLLLSEEMIAAFRKQIGREATQKLLEYYAREEKTAMIQKDPEANYFQIRREAHAASIAKIAERLKTLGFNFVLCSLKAKNGVLSDIKKETPICYGSFYA